ncbi:hypothetical protein, partial [Thermoflexus hugenholtzii]
TKNHLRVGEGQRLARRTPNEFALERPAASGRPAPTKNHFRVGEGRRPAQSALEGRFQSA